MQNYHITIIIFTAFNSLFIKPILIIFLTGIITLIGLPILSQDQYRKEKHNLVATLEEKGRFRNLLEEMKEAGLQEQLEQKEKFITLLAFRDDAFNSLSDDTYDKFRKPDKRKEVLRYHLIFKQVTREDIDLGKIKTAGGEITISSSNGQKLEHIKKFKDANVELIMEVQNGVIIEIDQVLLPHDF